MFTEENKPPNIQSPVLLLAFAISIFLASLLYLSYHLANTNKGTIAIPAGNTYLGPTAKKQTETVSTKTPSSDTLFTASFDTPWNTWTATKFPFSFSYPKTLTLSGFPNDPMDAVGITWNGKKPQENILISVIDLSKNKTFETLINKPREEFITAWWKQYSGLKGATPIIEFTNKNGLKGYKTRFINTEEKTPNLDIFFDVPNQKNLILRIANGILDPSIFDAIVDSVDWKKQTQ